MSRVASVVLLVGGAVLCVTWLVSPASSSPQITPPRAVEPAGQAQDPMTVEPIRLETVAPPLRFDAPRHDPFSYRSRPVPEPPKNVVIAPAPPAPPPVRLPLLVAIAKERNADAVDVFRAALSNDGFAVTMVAAGQLFAGFAIVDVRADGLTLRQQSSGESFVLALR